LIRCLAELGEFDLVALASPSAPVDSEEMQRQLGARSLTVIPHSPPFKQLAAFKSLVKSKPLGEILFRSEILRKTVADLSARNRYDACLILGDICMAGYAADVRAQVLILDMCDDMALNYERRALFAYNRASRTYYRWQAKIIRTSLRDASVAFTRILAISQTDSISLSRYVNASVVTVPNCVDVNHFQPARLGTPVPHNPRLLFVGAMGLWANRDAVTSFTASTMPRILKDNPGTRLQLVGPGTQELEIDTAFVDAHGFVEDLAAAYRGCDVFVCPLRVGTGIKNKLMEALASGCAIVSTDIGIEGLAVCHGEHLLVANDPVHFAEAVNRLLRDPELRSRLGNAARTFAEKEFSGDIAKNRLQAAMLSSQSLLHPAG
jgi:hypothetical protein